MPSKNIRITRNVILTIWGLVKALLKGKIKIKPIYHCLWYFWIVKERKKNIFVIIREFCLLYYHWESFPNPYFEYSMFLKQCKMNLAEMKTYVPQLELDKQVAATISYKYLTEDKALFSDLLNCYEIPQPKLVLTYFKGVFFDPKSRIISKQQADKLISASDSGRLFLKDNVGSEGTGIHAFEKREGRGYYMGEYKLSAEFICREFENKQLLLQEGVIQTDQFSNMNPDCLNSIRILTQCINGKAIIMAAFLKLGRFGNVVDNVSQGGLIVPIDVESGKMDASARIFYSTDEFRSHPETGFRFEGQMIERWDEVRDIILATALKFHRLIYVGWDVAITNEGVLIIEGNFNPSIYAHQVGGPGLADIICNIDINSNKNV